MVKPLMREICGECTNLAAKYEVLLLYPLRRAIDPSAIAFEFIVVDRWCKGFVQSTLVEQIEGPQNRARSSQL